MLVLHAVEGVHAHHQWLWRTLLGDHRPGVFPQRQNARLREVIANLVVHRVELNVCRFVDARAVGGEGRGAGEGHAVDAFAAVEFTGAGAAGQAFGPIIHARFVVRRARHRQGAVGTKGLGHHLVAGQQSKAWVIFFRVEGHRRLLDFGAFLRQINRLGAGDFLGEIQRGGHGVRLATGSHAVERMALQTAIPAARLRRVEVGPQRFAAGLECLCGGGVEHVQRWSGWALADRTFHAANPEWVARVFQCAVSVAVGFAAIHQRQRTDGWPSRVDALMFTIVIGLFFVTVVAGNQGFADFRHHHHFAGHRRHGFAGQRHNGRDRRAGNDFTVRQGACTRCRFAAAQGERFAVIAVFTLLRNFQASAFFEDVVHAPHGPHALGKMRVEVAVIDRITGYPIAIARTAVGDFIGVTGARADALGVDVIGVVVIGIEQPLMAMQVEDVLFVTVMGVAEFDEVTDVAVVDVGRFGRIQRHGCLDANLIGARDLPRRDVLKPGVGRYVDQHRHVTDGVRAEEEFFVGAGQAVVHRSHAQPVGDHFRAHAAGAVVDHECVAGRLQHMRHHRVGPVGRKGLSRRRLVLELRGEIAERLQPIGDRRIAFAHRLQRIGAGWKAAVSVAAHHDGIAFAGDDFVAIDHIDDRCAGLAFAQPRIALRVARLVIDDRMTGRRAPRRRQTHFFFSQRVAVSAAALRHHDHLTEQAIGNVTRRALTTEGGATAADGKRAFTFGIQRIGTAGTRHHQAIGVAAGVRRNVVDAVHRLQAVDLEPDVAVGDLLIDLELFAGIGVLHTLLALVFEVLVRVGLIIEQVLQIDRQAIPGGYAQHQWPWTLVGAQRDFARHCRAAEGQRYIMVIDHVAAQRVHHAVGVLRAEAVEHQRLIERHDVGHQVALAAHRRADHFDAKHRGQQQQQFDEGRSGMKAGHDQKPRKGCSQGTILDKTLGAIRVPQKNPLLFNELLKPFKSPGDIPHPIPHFSRLPGLPR